MASRRVGVSAGEFVGEGVKITVSTQLATTKPEQPPVKKKFNEEQMTHKVKYMNIILPSVSITFAVDAEF